MALNSLLVVMDECRYMMQNSHSARPLLTSASSEYGKHLSARERRFLDQAVIEYGAELEKAINNRLADERSEEKSVGGSIYPLSTETGDLLISIAFSDTRREVFNECFSKYLEDYSSMQYIRAKVRLGTDSSREQLLGAALLPLIVSRVEGFLGAVIRTGLSRFPSALGEPPVVPNEILIKYQRNISSSDIKRWQIDRQVADFLRGSPNDWRKTLERWAKVDMAALGADWDMFNEAIQRRHAIIHNGELVDSEYMAKVSRTLSKGMHPGSSLVCNLTYIEPVLVELETWAICLALQCSKRFFKDGRKIYDDIIARVTRLQSQGRWTQGLAIMNSYLQEPVPLKEADIILAQINRWFCLQELGKDNASIQLEIRSWRAGKAMNQATADYREVGRLALLRNYDELIAALNRYFSASSNQSSKRVVGEMPLMKRAMQESPQVKAFFRGGKQSVKSAKGKPQQRAPRRQVRRK